MPQKRRLVLGDDIKTAVKDIRLNKNGTEFELVIKLGVKVAEEDPDSNIDTNHPRRDTHRDFDAVGNISVGVDFIKLLGVDRTKSTLLISAAIASKVPGTGQ